MVTTIYGEMDEALLEKKVGSEEDSEKVLSWTEYWKDGELVHRSVDLVLKQGIDFGAEAASLI